MKSQRELKLTGWKEILPVLSIPSVFYNIRAICFTHNQLIIMKLGAQMWFYLYWFRRYRICIIKLWSYMSGRAQLFQSAYPNPYYQLRYHLAACFLY